MKPVQGEHLLAVKRRGGIAQKDPKDEIGDNSDCDWAARTVTAGQGPDPACYSLRWSENHEWPIDRDRVWVGERGSLVPGHSSWGLLEFPGPSVGR